MSRSAVLTLAVSVLLAGPAVSADAPSKVVDKALPLVPGGRLVVDTYKGSVRVTAWDREEASVHAVVTPDGSCDTAADLVERTRVRIEGGGREVRVVSDYDDLPKFQFTFRTDCGSRPFVAYEIRVPRGASLRVRDYKSRVSAEGVAGDVDVETYKGVVRLEGLAGKLDVETYKGDVVARFDGSPGEVRAETYKGEIEIVLPKGSRVDLHEETGRHGRFESDVETASGAPRVSAETHKGTIRLRSK